MNAETRAVHFLNYLGSGNRLVIWPLVAIPGNSHMAAWTKQVTVSSQ